MSSPWVGATLFYCAVSGLFGLAIDLSGFIFGIRSGSIIGYFLIKSQTLNYEPSEHDDWVPPQTGVPFGPFLALAALETALFFEEGVWDCFALFLNISMLKK